jgi:hypothetical protein
VISQLQGFVEMGDPQAVNLFFLQGLGHSNETMPIGIGLDHSHDPGLSAHNRFDLVEIVGESG